MSVARVTEITAESTKSFEDADIIADKERDVPPDYENLRTMEEFRAGIDGEVKKLRAAGLCQRDIDLWLAGARWANRMDRILLNELERRNSAAR